MGVLLLKKENKRINSPWQRGSRRKSRIALDEVTRYKSASVGSIGKICNHERSLRKRRRIIISFCVLLIRSFYCIESYVPSRRAVVIKLDSPCLLWTVFLKKEVAGPVRNIRNRK